VVVFIVVFVNRVKRRVVREIIINRGNAGWSINELNDKQPWEKKPRKEGKYEEGWKARGRQATKREQRGTSP